jgi:hypothetical protein
MLLGVKAVAVPQEQHPLARLKESLPEEGVVRTMKPQLSPSWRSGGDTDIFWEGVIPPQPISTDFVSIHFANFTDSSEADWKIRLIDRRGRTVKQYTSQNVFDGKKSIVKNFWSIDVPTDLLTIQIQSDKKPEGLSFEIDKYIVSKKSFSIKSIIDQNDPHIEDIKYYKLIDKYYKPSLAVAKLLIIENESRRVCTGFLVNGNTLMTNEHCIPETAETSCDDIKTIFGYESESEDMEEYQCEEVITKNFALDFALLRLEKEPGKQWGYLTISPEVSIQKGDKAFIIQHPSGLPKQIALQGCAVAMSPVEGRPYERAQDFYHTCDTEGGSSGSPILFEDRQVIGLHHFGFTPDDSIRLNGAVLISQIYASLPTAVKNLFTQK